MKNSMKNSYIHKEINLKYGYCPSAMLLFSADPFDYISSDSELQIS